MRRSPLHSLHGGTWFKLICGASYQHLPSIRNLSLAYTLAGADCIDVAADPSVMAAAREGIQAARRIRAEGALGSLKPSRREISNTGTNLDSAVSPWLMASINDGEDPHFRKAAFDPERCPHNCSRPCERVCPADAIALPEPGVAPEKCYGCGRCLPVCPFGRISTYSRVLTPSAIAPLVLQEGADAIEIHTRIGRLEGFRRLWSAVVPQLDRLKLVSVSCSGGEGYIDYLRSLYDLMAPLPCPLVWQTDGRPMSGDIGSGTAAAAVKLAERAIAAGLPGHVQLAGGTNERTVEKLKARQLLRSDRPSSDVQSGRASFVAGVAYGSYARKLLAPLLEPLLDPPQETPKETLDTMPKNRIGLERHPQLLRQAVGLASTLVSPLKSQRAFSSPERIG